ncbi:MAG TPA: sensor domain-containing diguanylate cyclase [Vicinamibacteria bacterium]|nr:sensor domain-containing diguanylate cyclase [Vicinamibacteria bacterium]
MTNEIDALRAELAALRQDLENLRLEFPDALLEGDIATERVLFMNRLACQVFRCSPEEVPTLTARDIFAESDYERAQSETRARIEQGYREGGGARYVRSGAQDLREFTMRRKDGSTFPAETHSTFILDSTGRPSRMRTIVRDITARKEMEAKLEELSFRDPLTGCFNRRYLDKRRGELEQDATHLACLLFDLTGFKEINDTYGHEEGDRVLQAFALFLLRLHRGEDILIRLGGDEFALFVKTGADEEGRAASDRVIASVKAESPAACSFGVAHRLPGETLANVMARADEVMYAAKGRSLRSTRR